LIAIAKTGYGTEVIEIGLKLLSHDVILVGCFFGYLLHKGKNLKIIYSRISVVLAIVILVALLFLKWLLKFNDWGLLNNVFAFCYGILIVNISTNRRSIIKLENPILNYLGRISYGIYMYHSIFIGLGVYLFGSQLSTGDFIGNVYLYAFSVALTILVSAISYQFFEQPFIKMKEKFMVVKSSSKR